MARERRPLSPWLYIIIGIAVSGYSLIVKKSSSVANQSAMSLFMYVGFVFIFVGLVRFVATGFRSTSAGKKEEAFAQKLADVKPSVDPQAARRIIKCHQCGTQNYSTSNYCHMCVQPLRK